LVVPQLVKFYEKRTILLTAIALAALIPPIPILLFINGYLPAPGTWDLFFVTIPFVYIANSSLSSSAIIRESMLGDISDEVELETHLGQQGLMYASSSLIGKLNTGLGILMAGLALEFIGFPQGSQITPSADHIFNLAMVQGPLVALLMIIPFAIFSMYKIDRFKHQEIITELENR
ncbi:MFS transporter, partial [Gammaproteobacteria bacterium]|nr:MFS transporter [Gammaproteobacteria bacterium]